MTWLHILSRIKFRSLFRRSAHSQEDVLRVFVAQGEDLSELLALPAFGEAQVHRFNDPLFVTARWGQGPGVAAPEGADAHTIGEYAQHALAYSKTHPRQTLLGERNATKEEREARAAWGTFCRDVAGSSVVGYRPEIHLEVRDLKDGVLRVQTSSDSEAVELPPDASAERIGDAFLRLLAEVEPEWPTARSAALVSEAGGGLVVHPYHGMFAVGPVRRIDPNVDDSMFAAAIRAALDQGTEDPDESEPRGFRQALAEVGLENADLAGGAMVSIRETTKGAITLKPLEPVAGGWDPAATAETTIPDGDPIAVARAARAALLEIPTRHRGPGGETGAAFGYNTAWLAVRDSRPERVADAIGLTARQVSSWPEGVEASYQDGIFVSPPTSGWIVAVGVGWFGNEPDVAAMSARLSTEVQYFATHSVVEAHMWERALEGRRVRRCSYVGETGEFEQQGEATEAERESGLADLDEKAAAELISEETVMSVATGWSLNPQLLGTTPTSGSIGIHGRLQTA